MPRSLTPASATFASTVRFLAAGSVRPASGESAERSGARMLTAMSSPDAFNRGGIVPRAVIVAPAACASRVTCIGALVPTMSGWVVLAEMRNG